MSSFNLSQFIACPKCKSDLEQSDAAILCKSCNSQYPILNNIPWLFRSPDIVLLQWRARISALIASIGEDISRLNMELRKIDILPETKIRLENFAKALSENRKLIEQVVGPILNYNLNLSNNYVPKIDEKVPFGQTIESYFVNIFRDWAWPGNENQLSLEAIKKVIPSNFKPQSVAFLGCGSGRLAFDLQDLLKPESAFAVDINPLLLFVFQSLLEGKSFNIWELPLAPLGLENVAVSRRLDSSKRKFSKMNFIFADACNLPFKAKSLDCVVTAWFIDIVKQDFRDLAKRVNFHLKKGGIWINLGPLGFNHTNISENYVIDEVDKIIANSGFDLTHNHREEIPYLQSPDSGQKRFERVYCFSSVKSAEAKEPSFFSTLPKWLIQTNEAIPQLSSLAQDMSRHQIGFQVLSAINGQNSVEDIIKLFATTYNISEAQSRDVVLGFLIEKFEL